MGCSPPLYDVIWLQKVKNTDISFFFAILKGASIEMPITQWKKGIED